MRSAFIVKQILRKCTAWRTRTSQHIYLNSLYFWRVFFARRSPSTASSSPSIHRNWAGDIRMKSYGKCETFSCWWFSLIPSHFQVIAKMERSFVLPLSRNWFFENALREEPELLDTCTWTSLCFSRAFFCLYISIHCSYLSIHAPELSKWYTDGKLL